MLFNLPLDLYIDLISLKYESPYIVQNQYIELQKTRNSQFPKEIRHKGLIYHYNITFLLSEGRCGISDVYFRTSYFLTGVREFRLFCRSTFQRILNIGSKKKTSKWQHSKSTQTIIQKKSKEEKKLDRISANAELVEKMNKIKVLKCLPKFRISTFSYFFDSSKIISYY